MGITINKEKNEVCITLNKEFYNNQAIKDSLLDFKEVCDGEVEEDKENQIIILKPKENEMLYVVGYEFCNYILGSMKNKSLV